MNGKRRFVFTYIIILLTLFPSMGFAQKKAIAEARANIKKGVNLEKAEESMRNLLQDSANIRNEKVWLTLFDAVKKQYELLNEKLYLKQQSDTAKFLSNTLHMFEVLEALDYVDAIPNAKGVVEPAYRRSHAAYLNQYRANLFNGGAYFLKKQMYEEAYKYFDAYIGCATQPLFTEYHYDTRDPRLPEAGYWAVFCGYKLNDVSLMDQHAKLAMSDEKREVYTVQYMAEAYLKKKDMAKYCETLEYGFGKYPLNSYFFPHLALYYNNEGRYHDVLAICDRLLALRIEYAPAFVAESQAYLHLGEYEKCIDASDKVINLGMEVPTVYMNAGLAYYNQTIPYANKKIMSKADKQKVADLYRKALPYLEKYRQLAPDDTDYWAKPLYDIYLNLNMGDEFEEMEQILTK